MNLFISYSTGDLELVRRLATHFSPYATVRYWDKDKIPGDSVWGQIYDWIDASDLLLAVITDKTVSRALAVGNEIGHAGGQGIRVIALVTEEVQDSDLACLRDSTYIRIDRANPGPAMQKLQNRIEELKNAELRRNILGLLGIVALIWLASKTKG